MTDFKQAAKAAKEWESMNKTTKAIGAKIIAILDNPAIAALVERMRG